MRSNSSLEHYGVKGMKWRHKKKIAPKKVANDIVLDTVYTSKDPGDWNEVYLAGDGTIRVRNPDGDFSAEESDIAHWRLNEIKKANKDLINATRRKARAGTVLEKIGNTRIKNIK